MVIIISIIFALCYGTNTICLTNTLYRGRKSNMSDFLKYTAYALLYWLVSIILILIFGLSIYSLFKSFDPLKCFLYAFLWACEALVWWISFLVMKVIENTDYGEDQSINDAEAQ